MSTIFYALTVMWTILMGLAMWVDMGAVAEGHAAEMMMLSLIAARVFEGKKE